MPNLTFPLVNEAAHGDEQDRLDHLANRKELARGKDAGHGLSSGHSRESVGLHGTDVMRQDDAILVRSPPKNLGVGSTRQADILDTDHVHRVQPPQDSADDVVIEVLIDQEPYNGRHEGVCCLASSLSRMPAEGNRASNSRSASSA